MQGVREQDRGCSTLSKGGTGKVELSEPRRVDGREGLRVGKTGSRSLIQVSECGGCIYQLDWAAVSSRSYKRESGTCCEVTL